MPRFWPCAPHPVTSPFGQRGNEFHRGIDIGVPTGTPLYAAADGYVVEGFDRVGVDGFGSWIWIDCQESAGVDLIYGHVTHADIAVRKGDVVTAGQYLGKSGNEGISSGPHLHFETWKRPGRVGGVAVDPMAFLSQAVDPGAVIHDPTDTLYADVSEWQVPVDDSYPYRVLCIRSNDGTHRDIDWAHNYAWCRQAANSGRLAFFIVYFVWRPNWQQTVDVLKTMVGEPHPRMAVMIDVESWGGQIGGDQSDGINRAYWAIADWLGSPARVIGYGNVGDLNALWRTKPPGIRLVVAGYGANPPYPGKVAHQYTDGQGYGGGLPEGCKPFGNCDMNSADGLSPNEFAAACGITTGEEEGGDDMAAVPQAEWDLLAKYVKELHGAMFNPITSQSRYAPPEEGAIWQLHELIKNMDANLWDIYVERLALLGDPAKLALVKAAADRGDVQAQQIYEQATR